MQENQKLLDHFNKSLIPYLGVFLLFLGVFRSIVYYYYFGINIVDYIQLSEVVTSFFDGILIAVIFIFWAAMQYWANGLYERLYERWFAKRRGKSPNAENSSAENGTGQWVGIVSVLIVSLIFGIMARLSSIEFFCVFIVLIAGLLILRGLQLQERARKTNGFRRAVYGYLCLIGGVMLLVAAGTTFQVFRVQVVKKYYGTTVTFDDKTVFTSDSLHYYIGKTDNYLFIYHEKERSSDVFPMSSVKKLHLATDSVLMKRKYRSR